MNAFLKSLSIKLGYLIAGFIILVAVIVCAVRFMTPVLDNHRTDFEKIASDFLQTPVTIRKVRVSWYHYQPVIRLNGVTILDEKTKQPVFDVKKISLLVSIIKSIKQWKIVTDGIMVTGAEVNVSESENGELTVREFSSLPFNQTQYKGETKFTEVMGWLSEEPYLILSDIDVYYKGIGKQDRFVTLYHLSLENNGKDHTIAGKAILHQEIPTEVELAAKWHGKPDDLANIKAHAYLYVSGFSLSQWAKEMNFKGWQVKKGITSAKIWADYNAGALQKIQSRFQSYGVEIYSDASKMTHHLNRLSGNIGWKRDGNNQIIAGDEILVDLPNHLWPVTNFSMTLTPDASGALTPSVINAGYIDLADIQPFLFSIKDLVSEESRKMLAVIKPKGSLQNTTINLAAPFDWKQFSINTKFSHLDFSPWQKYPGMENISGSLAWNGNNGEVKLNGVNSIFKYDSIFRNPVRLDQISGDVKIQHENNNWLMNITSLYLLNKDMTANASGSIKVPSEGSTVTDIIANMSMKQAKNVTQYLPQGIFDKELNDWLKTAFLSGEITSARAVLRGAIKDFPFDKKDGEFSIESKVNNIDFRFAPNWPVLEKVNGTLIFSGRKMTADVNSATTLGIPLANIHGEIPYLGGNKAQVLQVTSGIVETDFAHAMKYIHESPLNKNIGKMFAGVDLQGKIALKLGLNIPFNNPDATKVQGDLTINDSVMNLEEWKLKLDHLNGQVSFTENSTNAKNLGAQLFGKPIEFDLTTVQKSKTVSVIQASFTNNFNLADIEEWLKLPLSKVIKGSATINGVLNLSLDAPMELHLRSNLVGASVDLIDQYAKKSSETRNFSADIFLQANHPMRLKLNYGELFSTALVLDRNKDKYNLIGANLRFGKGDADWPPTAGIYITGEFDALDWEKIKTLTSQSSNDETKIFSAADLKNINIRVNRANLGGFALTQLNLEAQPAGKTWNIRLSSPEITGQLTVPASMTRQSQITAQIDKLDIHTNDTTSTLALDVKTLPAISVTANSVRYNDMPVGKIIFNATPSATGLKIQNLRITSSNGDLRATGEWDANGKGSTTHLQGGITSSQVSRLINSFGFDVKNFISTNGSLNFNMTWGNAPYSPALASLSGRGTLAMGAGRIVDIGGGSGAKMDIGKMLSIFSLQTIPRRLSLDFSDIFQKGYSFDSFRGDFTIQNGEVNTSNMQFDGPVARVGINGKIGLKNRDYNFILSVSANVTSSIPVAATLLTGNPLIGLGAFAVNSMIGSKVATNYYQVSGAWSNPVWKSISSGSAR